MLTHRLGLLTVLILILLPATQAFSASKPQYGGNLKVADELAEGIQSQELFEWNGNQPIPLFPYPYKLERDSLTVNLSSLDPDELIEIEKALAAVNDASHPCHWILDYPYFVHKHPTSITLEDGALKVRSTDPALLNSLLGSPCLLPGKFLFLSPFRRTQFGLEANNRCAMGRPFLDSITPVPVDPVNPYLSFKLNDVDLIPIPEERFQQIRDDPEVTIHAGPQFFLYLKTANLAVEQVAAMAAAIDAKDLARAVLNDHTEILLPQPAETGLKPVPAGVSLLIPQENPYRLLGERLSVQLQEAGFRPIPKGTTSQNPIIELVVTPVHSAHPDLLRYQVLANDFALQEAGTWQEVWKDLEASGQLLPLMIHRSLIAARKNILDLRTRADGRLDPANCWILQTP